MFADFAPKYWAVGLPVMPLRPCTKIPALTSWQALCAQFPAEDQREMWLQAYPDGNMGLPLGPAAGVVALDLDSEDPRVQAILDKLMPASPWKRIGKKGAVYAFKYNGERTYRIKDEQGKTILEVLSRGAQVVMPPSIHPDTQRPYEANCDLFDVLDRLPALPTNFEAQVRQALIDAGFKLSSRGSTKVTEWVPSGGRDSALVSMAGLLARGVLRKERTLLEAVNEVEAWVANYTEKVVGDAMDPEKGRKKLLEFLRRDIVENQKQLPQGWDFGMTPAEIAEMRAFFGEDVEEWPLTQILDHLEEQFKTIPRENVVARGEMIDQVLVRVAKSEQLSAIDEDMIINFIVSGSGRMMTAATIRKRLAELRRGVIVGQDHSEIAQALLKDLTIEGEIRFHNGKFYQWFGSYWRLLDEADILKRLVLDYGHLPAGKKWSDHKGILQVASKLSASELATIDKPGINFANGYLTTDMELLDHDPKFGATYVLPYRYVPDERAPAMFMSFLDQCWGQDEDYLDKVQALREAIAATLFKQAARFQRAYCLFGVAGSGKTTLMNILLGLVPRDAISSVSPMDWGDRFLPTMMDGKLINKCGDLNEHQMIPGGQFKEIVEGSEIHGQLKGGQIFAFRPLCAQWFLSNHLPRSRDTSAGFTRRWLIMSFNRAVPHDQKRHNFEAEILDEEREAIVAWAVPAILDLYRRSEYTLPVSHGTLIEEVANQNNSVRFFMTAADGGVRVSGGEEELIERQLYDLYYAFCRIHAHIQPVQLKRFRMIMADLQAELGFSMTVTREGGVEKATYRGLRIERKEAKRAA